MLILIGILTVIVFALIILFAFPVFSPIPYFPSNKADKKLILEALELHKDQVVVDIGAGDGWVVFEAARLALHKKLNTHFIALELNPVLVCVMWIRALFHPNRAHITIKQADMFKLDYSALLSPFSKYKKTFYLYISPWLISQALEQVNKSIKQYELISYFYPVKELALQKENTGVHSVYTYKR